MRMHGDSGAVDARAQPEIALAVFAELNPYCPEQRFGVGDRLREAGRHYRDMMLISEGEVEIALDLPGVRAAPFRLAAGQPIGEIGFLHGSDAGATVTALTDVRVRVIDDAILHLIEQADQDLYVRLLRVLGGVVADRVSRDAERIAAAGAEGDADAIDIRLCRGDAMMLAAKRLRYAVYCVELGRNSPSASHAEKILSDELDAFGNTFVALDGDEPVATLRVNFAWEGPLGSLAQLYGMASSPAYPHGVAVCTKLIVRRSHRRGPCAMRLVAAAMKFGRMNGVTECYIDCIPPLIHYYRAMGFRLTGERFMHVENGPSFPMKLDTVKHAGRLSAELTKPTMLYFYLKARLIKFFDRFTRRGSMA